MNIRFFSFLYFMKNRLTPILFSAFVLFTSIQSSGQNLPFKLGINLCGAEFGFQNLPGTINKDYVYPSETDIQYFAKKGFKVIALPFRWERVQHELNGALDENELSEIKSFLVKCNKYNIQATITMQNFASYTKGNNVLTLGTSKLNFDHYKDVWKKIATALNSYNVYGYDIMNEPRNIFGKKWFKAAQYAIDGIREADNNAYIIIDGENSSFSYDWKYDNNKLRKLSDPFDKILFDAHCYFDYNHSGSYDGKFERKITPTMGVEKVKPFIEWLKKYNKKGIIGEFGVPNNDSRWLEVMDNFLTYIYQNGIPANYWAAGAWWNDYPLSIHPQNGYDKPQMTILEKYTHQSTSTK
jgi:endoglucanase